jgi:hypothetical protein
MAAPPYMCAKKNPATLTKKPANLVPKPWVISQKAAEYSTPLK